MAFLKQILKKKRLKNGVCSSIYISLSKIPSLLQPREIALCWKSYDYDDVCHSTVGDKLRVQGKLFLPLPTSAERMLERRSPPLQHLLCWSGKGGGRFP